MLRMEQMLPNTDPSFVALKYVSYFIAFAHERIGQMSSTLTECWLVLSLSDMDIAVGQWGTVSFE